jgi:hypothetical protein
MKALPIMLAAALLLGTGIAQASPHGAANHMSVPFEILTPPAESSVPPPVNPGTLTGPAEFGLPAVNSGAIAPLNQQTINDQPDYGALPGDPGSATYDPDAALPSLNNPGSALAPLPGTSSAGFNSPSTNSGGF